MVESGVAFTFAAMDGPPGAVLSSPHAPQGPLSQQRLPKSFA